MLESKSVCLDYIDIQKGVSVAIWQNESDRVVAYNEHLHTLSLYIKGGHDTYRKGLEQSLGGPNKLCFMPAGHSSDWIVGKPLRLMHYYFTEAHLAYLGLTALDIDPRSLQLPDLTFKDDDRLLSGLLYLRKNLDPTDISNRLQLQDIQQTLLLYLLEQYSERKAEVIRGGLSPNAQSRVIDYMHNHFDQDIKLEQLADEVHMSTYHFSHMFKQSTGLSPYQFLLKQRMGIAANQLRTKTAIGQVGEGCAYSHPSHFARAFRREFGVTPKAYKQAYS